MIHYDLICEQFHTFDGWFRDSATFDEQLVAGLVTCPACGSAQVEKQLMTPGLPARSGRHGEAVAEPRKLAAGPSDEKLNQMVEAVRQLKAHVEANADYVGERFPEEARKIHYREAEARAIYGEASMEEASALMDEGIEVHPLPKLPEEGN